MAAIKEDASKKIEDIATVRRGFFQRAQAAFKLLSPATAADMAIISQSIAKLREEDQGKVKRQRGRDA